MSTIAPHPVLDTLSFARRLKAANMPEAQAEALTEALAEQEARQQDATAQAVRQTAQEGDSKTAQAVLQLIAHINAHSAEVAERFAKVDERFARLEGRLNLHNLMLTAVFAGIVTLLVKVFFG